MLRERITWFSCGAATTSVVAFLLVGHPRENPAQGAAQRITGGSAVANTMAAPTQSRDQRPVSPAAVAQGSEPTVAEQSMVTPVGETAISSEQSLRASRQIVTDAIEAGQWSNQDAAALASASSALSAADRRALYGKLAVAINQDRVHVESGLMPR